MPLGGANPRLIQMAWEAFNIQNTARAIYGYCTLITLLHTFGVIQAHTGTSSASHASWPCQACWSRGAATRGMGSRSVICGQRDLARLPLPWFSVLSRWPAGRGASSHSWADVEKARQADASAPAGHAPQRITAKHNRAQHSKTKAQSEGGGPGANRTPSTVGLGPRRLLLPRSDVDSNT